MAEALQKGFNCSSEDDWKQMRRLILHKIESATLKPDPSYMTCVATNHKECLRKRQTVGMIRRKCNSFSQMRFLSDGENMHRLYALAGTPGSGSNWVRFILEELTGVYTGSKYCDSNRLFSGYFGESMTSGRVLVVETYGMNDSLQHYDSVIYVVRNPYHTIVSQVMKKYSKTAELLTSIDMVDFQNGLKQWISSITSWIVYNGRPVHVVSYDQLLVTMEAELLRLLHFVDFPVSTERLDCVVRSSSNSFKYDRLKYRDPFTEEQKQEIQEAIIKYKDYWHLHKVSYHWTWET